MQSQKPILIQEQRLKLSPQMYQSIQLMALPIQELKTRIQEELENNPALELVEDKSLVSLEEAEGRPREDYDAFENTSDPGYTRTSSGSVDQEGSDAKQKFIEGALSRPESLRDHLLWQLRLQPLSPDQTETGTLLIQNLDNNGFFIEDPAGFAPERLLPLIPEMAELIQGFEPPGCCVKDYRESLLAQWRQDPGAPPEAEALIRDHLDDLDKGKLKEVAKLMKIDQSGLSELLEYVRTLNPTPGAVFSSEETRYVVPDLMVVQKEGEYVLILNDAEIPVLGINPYFEELLDDKGGAEDPKVRQFVSGQVKEARWFMRSIHLRNSTLLKIARAVVEFQRDFFVRGPKHLAPLTLKDIAEEVSVHETTVSRIANAKYIQTEWGIFPLKHFFSNSISGAGSSGSRFSKEGVKERIKELIRENSTGKKLSDQKIAELLENQGIRIARRTVAKYRGELNLDP